MTEQLQERLSALVDDELSRPEIQMKLKELSLNAEARASWSRYHLIGDAMRRELGPVTNPDLARSISRRIQDEPLVLAPGALKHPTRNWVKPAAGMAIAASVAVLAMVMAPQFINPQQTVATKPALAASQPTTRHLYVAENGTRWEMLKQPKVESRLNSYLVNHQEYAPAANMKGIMPFATFVSYDDDQ